MSIYQGFYNTGAIWGAIGPLRFFSGYQTVLWGIVVGALLPFIPWILNKQYPSEYWRQISIPLMLRVESPGRYQSTYITPMIMAYFFQTYCHRVYPEWSRKYTFLMAVGMDVGVAFCVLCVGFVNEVFASKAVWLAGTDRSTQS
jgi:OPT oligopeptide transporter protein